MTDRQFCSNEIMPYSN